MYFSRFSLAAFHFHFLSFSPPDFFVMPMAISLIIFEHY